MSDATWRKAKRTRSDDPDAMCAIRLLARFAARVDAGPPAIQPPDDGMVRLGARDRASYVWFLPCSETARTLDGSRPAACNHGIGVDRQYGQWQVRAWAHGAPGVHSVELHTHVVTMEILETAARLIGLPFAEVHDCGALSCKCPVCLRDGIPHDGLQLEAHKTLQGHPCHGSGWTLARRTT